MIRPIDDFRVVHLDETHSRLLFKADVVQPRITGLVIDLQMETTKGYVLFLTEDCPYEETLHVYYLDHGFRIRDKKELWLLYRPGVVRDVRWTDNQITFSFFFFDGERCLLEVHEDCATTFNWLWTRLGLGILRLRRIKSW